MYLRCAYFEGSVATADREGFESIVREQIAPQMLRFPRIRSLRFLWSREQEISDRTFISSSSTSMTRSKIFKLLLRPIFALECKILSTNLFLCPTAGSITLTTKPTRHPNIVVNVPSALLPILRPLPTPGSARVAERPQGRTFSQSC